jgi:hypothetical protein
MSLSQILDSQLPYDQWKNIYVNKIGANELDVDTLNITNFTATNATVTNLSCTNALITNCTASTLLTNNATVVTSLTMNNEVASSAPYFDASKRLSSSVLTNGQLMIGSTGNPPFAAAITGTANRVTVTNGSGSINLSGPQDIATTSSPTFSSIALTDQSLAIGDSTVGQTLLSGIAQNAIFSDNTIQGSSIAYNSTTGVFSVSSTGKYYVSFNIGFPSAVAATSAVLAAYALVTSAGPSAGFRAYNQLSISAPGAGTTNYLVASDMIFLNAGDTFVIAIFQNVNASVPNCNQDGSYSVYRLG